MWCKTDSCCFFSQPSPQTSLFYRRMSDNDDIEVDSDVSMATSRLFRRVILLCADFFFLAELAARLAISWLVEGFYLIFIGIFLLLQVTYSNISRHTDMLIC